MTASDFQNAGIPIEDSPTAVLYAESAVEWLKSNTTLSTDNLSELPSGAKVFIIRYIGIMGTDSTVTSESLGGMSQSFSTESKGNLLYDLANELIGGYMASQVKFVAAQSRWG